jgi:hypothetical protein
LYISSSKAQLAYAVSAVVLHIFIFVNAATKHVI